MHKILKNIYSIYKEGNFSYLLFKHVNRDFWDKKLTQFFPVEYIYNMTDFNYNKCFSLCINLSDTNAVLGTKEFDKYVKESSTLFRLEILISVLAPCLMYKYQKYYIKNGKTILESSNKPFIKEHVVYDGKVKEFAANINHSILDEYILTLEVPGITLELRKESVASVFNCLFEDSNSFYPFMKELY